MTADVEDRLVAAAGLAPQPVLDIAALRRAAGRRRGRRRLQAVAIVAVVGLVPAATVASRGLWHDRAHASLSPAGGPGEVYDEPLPPPSTKAAPGDVAFQDPGVEPRTDSAVAAVAEAQYRGDRYTLLRYANTRGDDCFGWLRGGGTSVTSCSAPTRSPVPFSIFGLFRGVQDRRQVLAGWAPSESTTVRLTFAGRQETRHVYRGWDPSRFVRPENVSTYFAVVASDDDPVEALDVLDRDGKVLATRRIDWPELGQMPTPDGFVSKLGTFGPRPVPALVDVLFRNRLADGTEMLVFGYIAGDGYCTATSDSLMQTPGGGAMSCGVLTNFARPATGLISGFSSGRGELTYTLAGFAPPGTRTVVLAEPGRAPVRAATADAGARWTHVAPFYLPWHSTPGTTVTALGQDGSVLATFTPR